MSHTFSCLVLSIVASSPVLLAHGGGYQLPRDLVLRSSAGPSPAGSSSASGNTPEAGGLGGNAGGSTGSTSGPGTAGPSGMPAAGSIRRGARVGNDPTRWVFWWEFHKDSILHVREAVDAPNEPAGSDDVLLAAGKDHGSRARLRPSRDEVRDIVLPALQRALERSDGRDLTTACLVALAKIGLDSKDAETLPLLRSRLASNDQEVCETAALALGITRRPEVYAELVDLMSDHERARRAHGRASIDERTRAFATYGLAVLAETATLHRRMQVAAALTPLLQPSSDAGRDLVVAAIHALRLCVPRTVRSEDAVAATLLRRDVTNALRAYVERDLGPGAQAMQAHGLVAWADVLGPGGSVDHEDLKKLCVRELTGTGPRRTMPALVQSAALALGRVYVPGKDDGTLGEVLFAYAESGKDLATRRFALVSLAGIGTAAIEKRFVDRLTGDADHLSRAWLALGLGAMAHDRRARGETLGKPAEACLLDQLRKARDPEYLGALAIAIGLAGVRDAIPDLERLATERGHDNDLAGNLCTAFALLGHVGAEPRIQAILERSARRPELLARAAVALGKLGNKQVTTVLIRQLESSEGEGSLARLGAISQGLGLIGDRRCLEPLVSMLADTSKPPLARAFVAVALGNVCDERTLPWNASLARGVNYLAPFDTLYDQVAGVLDIF